jgi:GT2 family glycosyltransferase
MPSGGEMIPLTISIVTANNKKLILACLRSIYETTVGLEFETYVVINNSSDDSEATIKKNFPEVKLIVNRKKLGFTHNHNMVMRKAQGKYILVLNDDTVILDGAPKKMVEFMEASPDVGILGCRLLNPDGSRQWSCGKSINHKFEHFVTGVLQPFFPFLRDKNLENTQEVFWVSGACLLVRAESAQQTGLFDENIIIYYEDADWCYRMVEAGWKVVFYPHAEIIHYHGQTRKKHMARDTFIIYQSRDYFFSKHYGRMAQLSVKILTIVEVSLRYLKTLTFSRLSADQRHDLLKTYRQILKLTVFPSASTIREI